MSRLGRLAIIFCVFALICFAGFQLRAFSDRVLQAALANLLWLGIMLSAAAVFTGMPAFLSGRVSLMTRYRLYGGFLIAVGIILIAYFYFFVYALWPREVTSYVNNSLFFECSQPIMARGNWGPNQISNLTVNYLPINMIEANQFCHATGIL
jgi:hypothetical protein